MNEMTPYDGQMPVSVRDEQDALMSMDYDNVLALAERADKMVEALNKIMAAAVRVTTKKDWVLIGGVPYLQESGATKVARLFGITWSIHPGYPKTEFDGEGYPTYTYRMTFRMGAQEIEAEGMRSAKDEFYAGKKEKRKSVDEIDLADVKKGAYTNCLNRGIKAILPGLRNLDAASLEACGVPVGGSSGYTFKTGSKGGNTGKAEDSGVCCEACGAKISQKVASYAQGKYGHMLCMACQKKADRGELDLDALDDEPEEGSPPYGDGDDPYEGRR